MQSSEAEINEILQRIVIGIKNEDPGPDNRIDLYKVWRITSVAMGRSKRSVCWVCWYSAIQSQLDPKESIEFWKGCRAAGKFLVDDCRAESELEEGLP